MILTILATTSGVDRGIRLVSELNLWSAAVMMVYILVTGQTAFLLNALVENVGRFIVTLPGRTLQIFAYEPGGAEWMGGWTLFFWAFWLAWGPFVGVFLARISRGRTLREFVIAAITAPVLCDFFIVSLFGNSALYEVLQGDADFANLAVQSPERGWYALLGMFPGPTFLIGLATLSGLLFYLTSANSGAIVTSNFSASIPDPSQDGPKWLRIFWAMVTAVLSEMLQWSMLNAPISISSILVGLAWGPVGVAASYSLTRVIIVNPLVYWIMGRSGPVRTKDLYGHLIPFLLASIGAFLACLAFRSFVVLNSTILNIAVSGVIILGTTLALLLLFPVGRSALLDVKYLLFFLRPLKPERSFDSGTGGLEHQ